MMVICSVQQRHPKYSSNKNKMRTKKYTESPLPKYMKTITIIPRYHVKTLYPKEDQKIKSNDHPKNARSKRRDANDKQHKTRKYMLRYKNTNNRPYTHTRHDRPFALQKFAENLDACPGDFRALLAFAHYTHDLHHFFCTVSKMSRDGVIKVKMGKGGTYQCRHERARTAGP